MKSSEKNATIPIGDTALMVNNLWGENKLVPGETYVQAIAKDHLLLNGLPYWQWQCETGEAGVKGYPQVLYGKNPNTGVTTTDMLPGSLRIPGAFAAKGVAGILDLGRRLDLDYSVMLNAKGIYNLMVDIWITSGSGATREQITHEIMIVLAGSKWTTASAEGAATIGGLQWAVRRFPHGRRDHQCIVFEYVQCERPTGLLPIHEILMWCRRWAGLRGGYLACVQLGTEIKNGSGICAVERYEMIWG